MLGVACLINDFSELEGIRRQQELHGEISAEMALQLRTSLTTIAGYAQQLADNRDPELAKQLATDIAYEAAHLDRQHRRISDRQDHVAAQQQRRAGRRINDVKRRHGQARGPAENRLSGRKKSYETLSQ